jgi:hypothetical protein
MCLPTNISLRDEFDEKLLVCDGKNIWYSLKECLWNAPFALTGYLDVAIAYPALETFFVKRLGVKKATTSMLIKEVERMCHAKPPPIEDIRQRLIEIGIILAKSSIDGSVASALTSLQETKFLPKKASDGICVLVGVTDDFAIPDHQRYADALASCDILLDFRVHEVQSLHVVFQFMALTHRYLSSAVKEASSILGSCIEDERLSHQLQAKAYALYW